jgi:hypothetical protein
MGVDGDTLRDPSNSPGSALASPWSALHDLLDDDLTDLARSNSQASEGVTAVLERDRCAIAVLRLVAAFGPVFSETEKSELERLLGHQVVSGEDGLRQLDDRIRTATLDCTDSDLLRFFYARADRQCTLLRPAMGTMADGHFSPIE